MKVVGTVAVSRACWWSSIIEAMDPLLTGLRTRTAFWLNIGLTVGDTVFQFDKGRRFDHSPLSSTFILPKQSSCTALALSEHIHSIARRWSSSGKLLDSVISPTQAIPQFLGLLC